MMYNFSGIVKRATALLLMLLFVMSACAEEPSLNTEPVEAAEAVETVEASEPAWENILLLGVDARDFSRTDRSDSMIILSINREESKVKLTSIMRDIWVKFPGTSKSGKINAGTVYGGPELAMETVNQYFGMDIESYVLVNFQDIIRIIDMLGGVDIEITEGERKLMNEHSGDFVSNYTGALYLDHAGPVHVSGALALPYARDRFSTGAGDFDRVKRQRNLLCAILTAAQEKTATELLPIISTLMGMVKTNLTLDDILPLMPLALDIEPSSILGMTIPVTGTFKSGMMGGVWKIVPNFDTNKALLHDFIYDTDTAVVEDLAAGSRGDSVRRLQQKLVEMGLLSYADGIYGDLTKAAVSEAQKMFGLEETGIADTEFQARLYE